MPPDLDDAPAIARLAHLRWGPTGFRCRHCGHTAAWHIRTRPRVRECRRCHRQTSVTAGTLLERTRLPLAVWEHYGRHVETRTRLPTTTELADELCVARSTAWLVNQKMMLVVERNTPADIPPPHGTVRDLRVRRPQPTRPMPACAPAFVRDLHHDHLHGRCRSPTVAVACRIHGQAVYPDGVALDRREVNRYLETRSLGPTGHDHYPLSRWLWAQLVLLRHGVSLRWLPRWLHATLRVWRLGHRAAESLCWGTVALTCDPRPLRSLDPWLAADSRAETA